VSPLRSCTVCATPTRRGNKCDRHRLPVRTGTYTRDAKRIVEAATHCHICLGGPRPDDPFVADHLIPHSRGGSDHPSNLAPAHRSCNGRRGQRTGEVFPA
jgi:5-methylcytosine-specific restriction endonuclease McrA